MSKMKQIAAVAAAVVMAAGITWAVPLDVVVVDDGPASVQLSGQLTATGGGKATLSDVPLQWALLSLTSTNGAGATNVVTWAALASSIPVTNFEEVVGSTTNTFVVLGAGYQPMFESDPNQGVQVGKSSPTSKNQELVDVYYDKRSLGSFVGSVLLIDAKLKTDKKTGDVTGGSATVNGIWVPGQSILKGKLK
jgi:hypothetical protein